MVQHPHAPRDLSRFPSSVHHAARFVTLIGTDPVNKLPCFLDAGSWIRWKSKFLNNCINSQHTSLLNPDTWD